MSNINYNFNKLTPFRFFCLTNFPFIEEDFDSLTTYELLCKIVEYLNKVINSNNSIGAQVEELTNAFNTLKSYVDNYFNNLDVQEEINNKLDQMVIDGTLSNIINEKIFNELNESINELEKNKANNSDLDNYILNKNGKAENLGVGNETYTSPSSDTSVVMSLRGNRASTNPQLPTASSVFAPQNSKQTSQYRGRDSVTFFSANQGRNPYLYVANDNSIEYGSNYVNYPETADISKIKVGMIIDTNHSTPFSGIITEINTVEKRIYIEDGWYYNGEKSVPQSGFGYSVGMIKKLWVSNKAISLLVQFDQVEGVGEELDLKNEITNKQTKLVGYDVATTGVGKGFAGYIARTGSAQFDQSSVGRLERGFIAENTIEGFETWSENDDDYLIISKDKFGNTQNNRFSITNKGLMTNPIINHISIQATDQKPNFRYAMWIFDNTEPMTYTLPNNSDGSYNYRFYTLISRSGKNVTISDTGFVLQGGKAVTYTAIPHGNENVWIRVSQT